MTTFDPDVRVERMRPEQIRACRKRADIAFFALGSIEWHGVQSPVGTDALKAHHVCCVAAHKLGGGAVFPPLVWGVPRDSFFANTHSTMGDIRAPVAEVLGTEVRRIMGFSQHGGMDVQEQWLFYQRLVRMGLEQIAGFGFRSIYICTGHNPLVHWVRPVAVTFARASDMAGQPVTIDFGGEFDAAGLKGDHGGKWETSLMMAVAPALVDLEEITRNPQYKGVGAGIDAIESTREQGEAWVERCASAMAEEARWLVDHYPELPARVAYAR